jgi:hypothetical protein
MITQLEYSFHKARITKYEDTRIALYPKCDCFTPEMIANIVATAGIRSAPTNEERSAVEVYEFCTDPPKQYFLYINCTKKEATTWMSDKLGNVRFGTSYKDNFGGQRVPITIAAINGKKYHGTYYKSAGDYARVKMYKS